MDVLVSGVVVLRGARQTSCVEMAACLLSEDHTIM